MLLLASKLVNVFALMCLNAYLLLEIQKFQCRAGILSYHLLYFVLNYVIINHLKDTSYVLSPNNTPLLHSIQHFYLYHVYTHVIHKLSKI